MGGIKKPKISTGAFELSAIPRGASSRPFLKLDWDYPVYKEAEVRTTGTAPVAVRRALSRADALRFIAGDDPRPLLVLRECSVCNKTDDALLKGGPENDRTLVLSRWFHCVKLPVDVIAPDHPFNALFPNDESEHLFLALVDGEAKIPLESEGSRTELWDSMSRILERSYEKNPASSYADVLKRIEKLDEFDFKIANLEARKGLEMESARPDRKKVDALDAEIAGLKARIDAEKLALDKAVTRVPKSRAAEAPSDAAKKALR
ncbi:MAG: hypothetical protein JNL28_16085 [Planctomycetes bacterium]|nr:hypothetical protein [Planctomycetota bacterium]